MTFRIPGESLGGPWQAHAVQEDGRHGISLTEHFGYENGQEAKPIERAFIPVAPGTEELDEKTKLAIKDWEMYHYIPEISLRTN